MAAVLAAQFLSAMADNALLFAALALLKAQSYPQWTDLLLQEFPVGLMDKAGESDPCQAPQIVSRGFSHDLSSAHRTISARSL
jgi:hypothetical protein